MSLSLNKPKLDNLAAELWKPAERLRGKFKAYEYQNVVLPIIVIRRLECVLIKWREEKAGEVLSNKYFYRYQPPLPADELLAEFWRLEKEAEALLKELAR
ncbi:MAG: type I restriction-modification system subunit M N-terminal domain-containing protein [Desulfobacterales bacterium]